MKSVENRFIRAGLLVAVTLGLAACTSVKSPHGTDDAPRVQIKSCVDQPLPFPSPHALGKLSLKVHDDRLAVDTPANPIRQLTQAAASVKIEVGTVTSSGIVTTDNAGREIVLTADHGVAYADKEDIVISSVLGDAQVAGYCGVYQVNGKLVAPPAPNNETGGALGPKDQVIDVAILRPKVKLPIAPLPRATQNAPRGSWLETYTYQNNAPTTRPFHYGGVAVTDTVVLTGVQGWRTRQGESSQDFNTDFGASGAGFVNSNSQVCSILDSGEFEMMKSDALSTGYNVSIGTGFGTATGMTPSRTNVTSIETINEILA